MAYRAAFAALTGALAGLFLLGSAPGQAADFVVHGRIGNAVVGIDTRDRHERYDRRGHRDGRLDRGHGRDRGDIFDPDLGEREFKERIGRRFEHEKLFNGGSGSFPADRRRRAQEVWLPPRKERRDHGHRRHKRGGYSGAVIYDRPTYYYGGGDHDGPYGEQERFLEEGVPPGEESREPQAAPEADPVPPDARGPRFEAARSPGSPPAVGERLPPGKPHVALDWEDYGLPRPPRGESYVRFDGAVLLIEASTRIVRRVLWPTG